MTRAVVFFSLMVFTSVLNRPAHAEPGNKIKWFTSGILDFSEIETLNHSSKFMSRNGYFTIIGRPVTKLEGAESAGIQGVYASQDPQVLSYCLQLAAQMNLQREGNSGAQLSIQVRKDTSPGNSSFAQIQYCTLTHLPEKE